MHSSSIFCKVYLYHSTYYLVCGHEVHNAMSAYRIFYMYLSYCPVLHLKISRNWFIAGGLSNISCLVIAYYSMITINCSFVHFFYQLSNTIIRKMSQPSKTIMYQSIMKTKQKW